ncbi:DUF6516 family protein [Afifella sp. IM 167]|uniref:toxin-antitoxin system TumE family protein n=1 Tax=Afifella sp. IM 167 TaxID=2033586 RepID=UPI001CCC365D|nr:DUF6516 family protein [Afifella sp. IM 167]MBZ8133998.1 hypothetical protein [Afifella sp. IM 167]
MKAEPILDDLTRFDERSFVQLVIWRVPKPLRGSGHLFKYRLAYVVDGVCVLRYDNEAGKGDHVHDGNREGTYDFITIEQLLEDFYAHVERRRR